MQSSDYKQLSLQDYLTFYNGCCADDLTRSQLKQILSIHGFVQLGNARKEYLMDAVRSLPMIPPVRSTINTNLVPLISLHVASLSVLEVTQDMQVIGWEEGSIQSVKTIEPKVPSMSLSFKVEQVPKTDGKLKEQDKGSPSICAFPSWKLNRISGEKTTIQIAAKSSKNADPYTWHQSGSMRIIGFPHLRRYYKCTEKGCFAKKHIDRDATDPSMYIITYKGSHNHPIP
ncbi:WRKY DNA-binding protein 26 [Rhynchospora pubera]|uniref:WRKY DNA-binding protein 26 n=1 Tax=Rhynchospora pubera TaxID=906938 RepID=A0AAV8AG73_9POAL|nr:WRKY DNA-binding protein 26 [Rhynchospora pubera]KAJ4787769.1 WRKY DNA-binding protein 26 [Rhynchospora pubera]